MKNIVICCDGTWNRFDKDRNTNVAMLAGALVRQSDSQVTYYDPGVGTIAAHRWRSRLGGAWDKLKGGAFGMGLDVNLEQAYTFLTHHYEEGDRIFLFGFSRGAYTVRALAAMLRFFGLLESRNENLYPYMREIALRRIKGDNGPKPDFRLASAFGHNFTRRRIPIHFVGVWDTVSSVGWLHNPISLPYTSRNQSIMHVRHAVAFDETRKNFRQNLVTPADEQDCKEVWFAGAHGDVGGGHPRDDSGLAAIGLEWMLMEAIDCGLLVNSARVTRILGLDNDKYSSPDPLGTLHDPYAKRLWKLLQWAPRLTYDMGHDPPIRKWDWRVKPRPRFVPDDATVHESVLLRSGQLEDYTPPVRRSLSSYGVEPWRRWSTDG